MPETPGPSTSIDDRYPAICIVLEYAGIAYFAINGETLASVSWAVLIVVVYVAGINFITRNER